MQPKLRASAAAALAPSPKLLPRADARFSRDYRRVTSTPIKNATISDGSGASRTMPRTMFDQCGSGARLGDLISAAGAMPHSDASSAISLDARHTPSRIREIGFRELARGE